MFNEDHQKFKNRVSEFVQKVVKPAALKVEKEGIGDLIGKLAAMGFTGAIAPREYNGSEMDRMSYAILLEELAKESPSLSFYVFIQNSLVIESLLRYGSCDQKEHISRISRGEADGTMIYPELLDSLNPGELAVDEHITGIKNFVIHSSSKYYLFNLPWKGMNRLAMLHHGVTPGKEYAKLGLRGLRFSPVSIDVLQGEAMFLGELDGIVAMNNIFRDSQINIAAISMGIAQGALEKAFEYSKERKVFGNLLSDFQPLAFSISEYMGNMESMKSSMYHMLEEGAELKKMIMMKVKSLEFARSSAKLALQIHGGYGYIEEYGIERFYRDSMALSVFSGRTVKDRIDIAHLSYNDGSAKF